MSLDVTLVMDDEELFTLNITHNLTEMATAAGCYKAMWRPEELGYTKASEVISSLELGLAQLMAYPEVMKTLEPENKWGSYATLLRAVRRYLAACKDYPGATILICR